MPGIIPSKKIPIAYTREEAARILNVSISITVTFLSIPQRSTSGNYLPTTTTSYCCGNTYHLRQGEPIFHLDLFHCGTTPNTLRNWLFGYTPTTELFIRKARKGHSYISKETSSGEGRDSTIEFITTPFLSFWLGTSRSMLQLKSLYLLSSVSWGKWSL